MKSQGTLLIKKSEIELLATLQDYIIAMELAFQNYAEGKTMGTGMLHFDAAGGLEFHLKAGGLTLDRAYFGLKINGASFKNMQRFGLPNILGAILLFDGESGYPVAIMDSIEITQKRTGATTALAAKYLAKQDSSIATICGCGNQGRIQLKSIMQVLALKTVYAFDMNIELAKRYAEELSRELDLAIIPLDHPAKAVSKSDVVITCTPSTRPYIFAQDVREGTFIAAVGADSPDKQEIDENILKANKVVVDILDQCAKVGELHHAITAGLMRKEDVHGELGDVIAGKVPGRESNKEIAIYDATGTALQDVAAAAICYQKAIEKSAGTTINLFG